MKKTLSIIIAVGAVTAMYITIRRKYMTSHKLPETKNTPRQHQHHLTNAFANAKKHAIK